MPITPPPIITKLSGSSVIESTSSEVTTFFAVNAGNQGTRRRTSRCENQLVERDFFAVNIESVLVNKLSEAVYDLHSVRFFQAPQCLCAGLQQQNPCIRQALQNQTRPHRLLHRRTQHSAPTDKLPHRAAVLFVGMQPRFKHVPPRSARLNKRRVFCRIVRSV